MASSWRPCSLFLAGKIAEIRCFLGWLAPPSLSFLSLNKSCVDVYPKPPAPKSHSLAHRWFFKSSLQVFWWQMQATFLFQLQQNPSSTSMRGPHCGFKDLLAWKMEGQDASILSRRRLPMIGANLSSPKRRYAQDIWRRSPKTRRVPCVYVSTWDQVVILFFSWVLVDVISGCNFTLRSFHLRS